MASVTRLLAGLAVALALAGVAHADFVSEAPDSVSITAYRDYVWGTTAEDWENYWQDWDEGLDDGDGLVLVTETRTIEVPAGRAKISFRGVAEGIIPQTAAIEGLPAAMIERNQDYDLLTPAALIDKSIGKHVRLVRTNTVSGMATEESALVRSGPDGTVLDYGDGRVEAVGCSGWPERLVFEELPEGLADKATLSVVTDAPQPGRYTVRLIYLALGVKWGADYIATVHPDGRKLDLAGWITLANRSNTGFVNAPTQVLAGKVARDEDTRPPEPRAVVRRSKCWPMDTTTRGSSLRPPPAALALQPRYDEVQALIVTAQKREENIQDVPIAISAFESELADYKLYTIPEPTTVAAHQTKQVMMFYQPDIPFERLYLRWLDNDDLDDDTEEGDAPTAVLRMVNKRGSILSRALPAGMVRVMEPRPSGTLLTGQRGIYDQPVGMPVDIDLDQAPGVAVSTTELSHEVITRDGETVTRRHAQVVMHNDRPETITIELHYRQSEYARFVSASRRHAMRYGDLIWTFRLRPGESQTMKYVADEG